jgi:hypothetical protein
VVKALRYKPVGHGFDFGFWRISFITAYMPNVAFLFWTIWTFCAGPGGSYTAKPAGPWLQAGIWMSQTGRNSDVTVIGSQPPPPPSYAYDNFHMRSTRPEDSVQLQRGLWILYTVPSAMKNQLYMILDE